MSIQLDEKHGVNPSVEKCFVCGEDKGVVLFGLLSPAQREAFIEAGVGGGAEAPREVTLNKEPCTKCEEWMEQGVILISVDAEKTSDMQNPHRTGGWCVLTESAVKRMITDAELLEDILHRRMSYVPDDAWDMMNLPRGAM
jgi:hypothetical protein